jgi:hypothetical protein
MSIPIGSLAAHGDKWAALRVSYHFLSHTPFNSINTKNPKSIAKMPDVYAEIEYSLALSMFQKPPTNALEISTGPGAL